VNRIVTGQLLLIACFITFPVGLSAAQDGTSNSTPTTDDTLQVVSKSIFITPYVGGSTLVGNLGVEFRYKNVGYCIGDLVGVNAIDNIICGGIRYYFKPNRHSWTIGIGGGIALDKPGSNEDLCGPWSGDVPDDWVCGTESVIKSYIGLIPGYRWIWRDTVCMNIGAGPNYILWQRIKDGGKAKYLPMLELVLGYTF